MTSEWERRERKRKRRDTDNKDCGEECNTMDRFWRLLLVCFLWSSVVAQYVGRGRGIVGEVIGMSSRVYAC